MTTMPVDTGFYVTSGFGPRWGTVHYGTDFGRDGGSGGHPVYAVRDGTVTAAGPAAGFGRWINLDHPSAVGGGLSVYGHIIPEVSVGQVVTEGQRIGRIDPNQATNGGVAPHLHYEYHRYVWSPPGPNRLDPMKTILVGAKWPGKTASHSVAKPDTSQVTTLFGVDISNHQNPISCKRIADEGFRFCIIKATEGTWRDPVLHSHLADARSTDMHVAAYVYVRGETSAEQHAQALHDHLGDTTVPIALDIEDNSGTNPAHWRAIRDAIEALGYRVILTYLPEWYWKKVGKPDLSGLPPLWTSWYPDTKSGYASVIYYERAGSAGWNGYGGLPVAVWQFTDRAQVAGLRIDANAYRGTEQQLRALFHGDTHNHEAEELDMSAVQEIKDYIDARITGPIGSDVKDNRHQLTGGRDKGEYPGWPQLDNRTLVDALAVIGEKLGIEGFHDPHGGSLKAAQDAEKGEVNDAQ